MSGKTRKIYEALVAGAQSGLANTALFEHVVRNHPKATSGKIVKASLLALVDPDLNDEAILQAIYALAIKHRLHPLTKEDIKDLEESSTRRKSKAAKKPKAPKEAKSSEEASDHGQAALA